MHRHLGDVTGFTWNDRVTPRAGAKPVLPPWEAVTVQVPGATVVTVVTVVTVEPDTVHTGGVLEVNDTGSPEFWASRRDTYLNVKGC